MADTAKQDDNVIALEIKDRIADQVESLAAKADADLPGRDSDLVTDYVHQIQKTYDVSRSKMDTDNAIQLLYIAYNTTPQSEGDIRIAIDGIMRDLVQSQQNSQLKMQEAVTQAGKVLKSLDRVYDTWVKVRPADADNANLSKFLLKDMAYIVKQIEKRATTIQGELQEIENDYTRIIKNTSDVTDSAQLALARHLDEKAKIEEEIRQNEAQAAKLKTLVDDLKGSIDKYQKLADKYEQRAETAEKRAFIMSIVRIGAEMITASVPAITAALTAGATGGSSVLAASAVSTTKQLTSSDTASTSDDKTAKTIEAKKELIDAKADKEAAEEKKKKLEEKGEELEAQKEAVEKDDKKSDADKATEVAAIDKRIKDNEDAIEAERKKLIKAKAALEAAQGAMQKLGEGMKELSQEQKDQAASLREMQMDMLNKVEAYETAKREQAAELVKINALLKGQRTKEETIELAIKSLNLSIRALQRMLEIVRAMKFFFSCFAAFMGDIAASAQDQAEEMEDSFEDGELDDYFRERIVQTTSEFLISQAGQWHAVEDVAARFQMNFEGGWSELNALMGNYLEGDALTAYMKVAANQIDAIAAARSQASMEKIMSLNEYRAKIKAATDVA